MILSSVGLFIVSLFLGHQFSKVPLEQLGNRPLGNDLWSWLLNFVCHFGNVGIWGYDASLGCWSPPIRLLLHLSVVYFLSSLGYFFDFEHAPFWATLLYCSFLHYYHHMLPNVSHPGGPRVHKIQRQPQFPNMTTSTLPWKNNWRNVVAAESHKDTAMRFKAYPESYLSGESVGRQIWTASAATTANTIALDETVIQELAAGGRNTCSFNPGTNPNRCVNKIFFPILRLCHYENSRTKSFFYGILKKCKVVTWCFVLSRYVTM
jgi:hypothetical protein